MAAREGKKSTRKPSRRKAAELEQLEGGFPPRAANDPHANFRERARKKYLQYPLHPLKHRSEGQLILLRDIAQHDITLAIGPAGTGKTHLAVAMGLQALERGDVQRLVLARPAVAAGEDLGFLPGDIAQKLDPYLKPLFDEIVECMDTARGNAINSIKGMMQDGLIEIVPVGMLRGRTLKNAFIVVDEVQNCTYDQLKMVVTRLGLGSKMVLTGDPTQVDLDGVKQKSGLLDLSRRVKSCELVAQQTLQKVDVVRHPTVAALLEYLDD